MVPRFRFWHKSLKKMYKVKSIDWTSLSYSPMYITLDEIGYSIGESYPKVSSSDGELMQWTGLVDKNGVEVFEGDIVKYHEQISSDNELQREIQGADLVVLDDIGFIEWDDEGADFSIVLKSGDVRGFFTRGEQDFEVIGNIYENPELLEGAARE